LLTNADRRDEAPCKHDEGTPRHSRSLGSESRFGALRPAQAAGASFWRGSAPLVDL
jgi:hypothetical protein